MISTTIAGNFRTLLEAARPPQFRYSLEAASRSLCSTFRQRALRHLLKSIACAAQPAVRVFVALLRVAQVIAELVVHFAERFELFLQSREAGHQVPCVVRNFLSLQTARNRAQARVKSVRRDREKRACCGNSRRAARTSCPRSSAARSRRFRKERTSARNRKSARRAECIFPQSNRRACGRRRKNRGARRHLSPRAGGTLRAEISNRSRVCARPLRTIASTSRRWTRTGIAFHKRWKASIGQKPFECNFAQRAARLRAAENILQSLRGLRKIAARLLHLAELRADLANGFVRRL